MLSGILKTIFAALPLALMPCLAQAQSSDFDRAFAQRGAVARLTFSIPLGDSPDKAKTAPRLDFGVRNYAQDSRDVNDWMLRGEPEFRDARFGLTPGDAPQLMLNGQPFILRKTEEQANIGTAGKIGLGVVAVVLAATAAVAILIVDCDSRDCFTDDE